MPNYGDPTYWDKRYKEQDGTFDWLEDWNSLKELISDLLEKDAKILILGCGNAEFSEHMYEAGFHDMHNIDISPVVIDQMKERNKDKESMTWDVMDVRELTYKDWEFDIAIDKSTIDALLWGDDAFLNVAKMCKEVQRVLKPGGIYFVISYGRPENRIFHFERDHLDFEIKQFVLYPDDCKTDEEKNDKSHFVYIWTKGSDSENADKNWGRIEEQLVKEAQEDVDNDSNSDEEDNSRSVQE